MRFPFTLLIACCLLAAVACKMQDDGASPTPGDGATSAPTASLAPGETAGTTAEPTAPTSVSAGDFVVATEYGVVGLAEAYRGTGLDYAKLTLEFGVWGNIEPDRGVFNWGPMDGLVAEYQAAGYTGIQLVISAESGWASRSLALLNKQHFPKDEYVENYRAFVRAFVERYDGDGEGDAPGLLYPVHHYGIEREFTGFWGGSGEDYVRLLEIAYPAIKEADPEAEVLLVALLMIDVFHDDPDLATRDARLSIDPGFRKPTGEARQILAACDFYDIVDFHSLSGYREIEPTADWIREELAAAGCPEKPIWIGDAFSMSLLVGYNARPFFPGTEENKQQVIDTLKDVALPSQGAAHEAAVAWLRAELARDVVRKVVVSAGEGLRGINIGNQEDWTSPVPGLNSGLVPGLGAALFMGMRDTSKTNQRPYGDLPYHGTDFARKRTAGDIRPAYEALAVVWKQIHDFTSVERLDLGEDVWAYRFERERGPVTVVWYDDGVLQFPGETEPTKTVQVPVGADSSDLTFTPTGDEPTPTRVETSGGAVTVEVDSTPVFVE